MRPNPHYFTASAQVERRYLLRSLSYGLLELIRIADAKSIRICSRWPWRQGPPADNDDWCEAAWQECTIRDPKRLSTPEWLERVQGFQGVHGLRPLLPVHAGGVR